MFLWEEIKGGSILEKLVIKPGIVLWKVERKNASKSGKMKLSGSKLYQQMTIRNVNTVRKIHEIMEKIDKT